MIWLLGTGYMGREYAKVLKNREQRFIAIGRDEEKAQRFSKEFGIASISGGIENYLRNRKPEVPSHAIVAVDADQLYIATKLLIEIGVKSILLEKPGGLNFSELNDLASLAEKSNSILCIAYNRRFYGSTLKAIEMIAEDGGVKSFHFEFTEWGHVIEKITKSKAIFDAWLLASSTHVIDLAFLLGGKPKEMKCYSRGENIVSWHPQASSFVGCGVSDKDALFSYQANWAAPGRWSVEILTDKHRYYFKPMESLQVQKLGSVALELVDLGNELDTQFKPGLYNQVTAFLNNDVESFKSIHEQLSDFAIYQQILKGN